MQTTLEARHPVAPSRSRAANRRRRLKRGIELWNLDCRTSPERIRRVAEITLTIAADDLTAAEGQARAFWNRVRQRFVGTRYFCWAELQRRGQVHYHALWLNPPGRRRADLVAMVGRWWALGRTQVRFKDAAWAERDMLAYALKYAQKIGQKRYQQAYDAMPRGLRTFMCQRFDVPRDELEQHLDRDQYAYVPAHVYLGEWVDEALHYRGRLTHVHDSEHPCCLYMHRRPRAPRAPPRPGAPQSALRRRESSGGSRDRAS